MIVGYDCITGLLFLTNLNHQCQWGCVTDQQWYVLFCAVFLLLLLQISRFKWLHHNRNHQCVYICVSVCLSL